MNHMIQIANPKINQIPKLPLRTFKIITEHFNELFKDNLIPEIYYLHNHISHHQDTSYQKRVAKN